MLNGFLLSLCLAPAACRLQFEGSNDKQYIVVRDSEIMAALA